LESLFGKIFTFGELPYKELTNDQVLNMVPMRKRLRKPECCSQEMYEIMMHCWSENPIERPSFNQILNKLNNLCSPQALKYLDSGEIEENPVEYHEFSPMPTM